MPGRRGARTGRGWDAAPSRPRRPRDTDAPTGRTFGDGEPRVQDEYPPAADESGWPEGATPVSRLRSGTREAGDTDRTDARDLDEHVGGTLQRASSLTRPGGDGPRALPWSNRPDWTDARQDGDGPGSVEGRRRGRGARSGSDRAGGEPGPEGSGPDGDAAADEGEGEGDGSGSGRRRQGRRPWQSGGQRDESERGAAGRRTPAGGRRGTARGAQADGTPKPVDPGAEEERAREICIRQLAVRPRTRAELAKALARRDVAEEIIAEVLDRYDEVGLIDDAAFARAWVTSRHHGKGLARRALANELRQRGVDAETASEALGAVDDDAEAAAARALAERKLRSARGTPEQVFRRLVGMLARKGYPAGVAIAAVKDALARRDAEAAEFADGIDADALADAEGADNGAEPWKRGGEPD